MVNTDALFAATPEMILDRFVNTQGQSTLEASAMNGQEETFNPDMLDLSYWLGLGFTP